MNRKSKRMLNTEVAHQFVRVLGSPLTARKPNFTLHADPSELFAVLGPGEQSVNGTSLLFWNLVRDDDKEGFTLFAEPGKEGIHGSAKGDWESLHNWLLDRLSEVFHGEELPMFAGSSSFVIHSTQR